jgi:hypothetical protein
LNIIKKHNNQISEGVLCSANGVISMIIYNKFHGRVYGDVYSEGKYTTDSNTAQFYAPSDIAADRSLHTIIMNNTMNGNVELTYQRIINEFSSQSFNNNANDISNLDMKLYQYMSNVTEINRENAEWISHALHIMAKDVSESCLDDIKLVLHKYIHNNSNHHSKYYDIILFISHLSNDTLKCNEQYNISNNNNHNIKFNYHMLSAIGYIVSRDKYQKCRLLCLALSVIIRILVRDGNNELSNFIGEHFLSNVS